ncbi:serine/threonine-protein kinase Chk2-like [Pollicipes pollicipes]|uniref:serine/threonine-protein kinase Chk2-like n=1 Tax=Pollicipes pollicipes TaxID=41117 RepID=UPI00188564CD|nr:serine/threonine-protein kinase Chk2-like [Pollicipes pollicipes]XP_037092135.1 serine/threonine-protein kinase Chk2-like [Pollicipes pollicipes]XP_037092137.1 serine/threonine-protein kinase Chk2-like [Pollicipes pollicipes]XP_037092138.1 serine/threonine-protein kinase Chk2-like [Pollicipes pollicipes]XP_037092139.1 serine/threonine-protein kinase Chk2-like [Pollicipes pollicipes]XP_037092140.1 serine/threonine-protein kinase Chk2-like [Pollicipes pollicipes]XP_037093353.1 serine/threoni
MSQAPIGDSQDGLPNTQDVTDVDALCSESQEEPPWSGQCAKWGRLFPVGIRAKFDGLDLCKNDYTLGRGETCDVVVGLHNLTEKYLLTISKTHLRVVRDQTASGFHVYVEDLSSNGTFVNGELVGRGKKVALKNNDEISLSMKTLKVFVFHDYTDNDAANYPEQLRRQYTMSRVLGAGACGEVRLAFRKGTVERFAVKIISKKRFTLRGQNQISQTQMVANEVNVLRTLDHPCVIRIHDVIDSPTAVYIVLELVEGGELFDRVLALKQLDESTAKLYFYQMLQAVRYLHQKGIAHRDLKPENVLLASEERETLVKITDFGLAKIVEDDGLLKTLCGTPTYVAPEVLKRRGDANYTHSVDCWSLGVILFVCLAGYPPFSPDYADMPLQEQILRGRVSFARRQWRGVSEPAKELVRRLLTVDPARRITVQEALQHPWLQDKKTVALADRLMSRGKRRADDRAGPPARRRRTQGATNGHSPAVNGHPPAVNGHPPAVNGHPPAVNGHPPAVNGHPPPAKREPPAEPPE